MALIKDPAQLSANDLARKLTVSLKSGLSRQEAENRLKASGQNILPERDGLSLTLIVLKNLRDVFVVFLLISAGFAYLIGGRVEAFLLILVAIVNLLIRVWLEISASRQVRSLDKLEARESTIIRGGEVRLVNSADLVLGDLVLIEAGIRAPADIRLVEIERLQVDEAILTGESAAVEKTVERTDGESPIAQKNLLYQGTLVVAGRARGLVVATGSDTVFGQLALKLTKIGEKTPLETRLERLALVLSILGLTVIVALLIFGLAEGQSILPLLLFSTSLFIAAIPESLPTVVTLALSQAAYKLANRKAVLRNPAAIEGLAAVTVVAADKTGTLTEGRMTVTDLAIRSGKKMVRATIVEHRSGKTSLLSNDRDLNPKVKRAFFQLVETGTLASKAVFSGQGVERQLIGPPTEGAVYLLAERLALKPRVLRSDFGNSGEIPFDSKHRFSAVIGDRAIAVLGAPEILLGASRVDARLRSEVRDQLDELLSQGLRVLAVAKLALSPTRARRERLVKIVLESGSLSGLEFLGLVGIRDRERESSKRSVELAVKAGIRPVVVTGDHPETARHLVERLGIKVGRSEIMTGDQLNSLSDAVLKTVVKRFRIFARISPAGKVRIIKALKDSGEVVAVTGDGVNDVLALQGAQVGIAMGRTGSDVAREAADIVLLDDTYATIIDAIRFGRLVYDNIRRAILFLLGTNLNELLLVALFFFLGWPLPFTAATLLLINLVTDTIPATALSLETKNELRLESGPRDARVTSLSPVIFRSALYALILLSLQLSLISIIGLGDDLALRTNIFLLTIFFELGLVFSLVSRELLWRGGARAVSLPIFLSVVSALFISLAAFLPALRDLFGFGELRLEEVFQTGLLAIVGLLIVELTKGLSRMIKPSLKTWSELSFGRS